MQKLALLIAVAIASTGLAATSNAAGWAITADTPLSYTFDKKQASDPIPPNNGFAEFSDTTASNVSGSKVMIIAPFHVGVGYEDYSVKQKLNIPPCGFCSQGNLRLGIRMTDVMIDIPGRFVNLGLGYGTGTADVEINLPAALGIVAPAAHNVSAEQTFIVLGIPLGQRFDLHVGYHVVTVDRKIVKDSNGNLSHLQESGSMLSAGARLNF